MDIAALVALAFVASITPGPNNLMLVSGAAAAKWLNDDRRTMLMNRFLGVLLAGTVVLLFV